jgi:hypothetical protein
LFYVINDVTWFWAWIPTDDRSDKSVRLVIVREVNKKTNRFEVRGKFLHIVRLWRAKATPWKTLGWHSVMFNKGSANFARESAECGLSSKEARFQTESLPLSKIDKLEEKDVLDERPVAQNGPSTRVDLLGRPILGARYRARSEQYRKIQLVCYNFLERPHGLSHLYHASMWVPTSESHVYMNYPFKRWIFYYEAVRDGRKINRKPFILRFRAKPCFKIPRWRLTSSLSSAQTMFLEN